jgi:hypothetical protein
VKLHVLVAGMFLCLVILNGGPSDTPAFIQYIGEWDTLSPQQRACRLELFIAYYHTSEVADQRWWNAMQAKYHAMEAMKQQGGTQEEIDAAGQGAYDSQKDFYAFELAVLKERLAVEQAAMVCAA